MQLVSSQSDMYSQRYARSNMAKSGSRGVRDPLTVKLKKLLHWTKPILDDKMTLYSMQLTASKYLLYKRRYEQKPISNSAKKPKVLHKNANCEATKRFLEHRLVSFVFGTQRCVRKPHASFLKSLGNKSYRAICPIVQEFMWVFARKYVNFDATMHHVVWLVRVCIGWRL